MALEEFFKIDMHSVFDEFGDEIECRLKTKHSQGQVGKVIWKSAGEHEYTGIFEGADTCYARLSTNVPVIDPAEAQVGGYVM